MERFSLMTFNVRGAIHDDSENVWSKRADLNVRTIQKYNPDLIGFQELQMGNMVTYYQNLVRYAHILGPESSEMARFNYNAIFWNPERFEVLDFGGFYLSRTPDRWSGDWDTDCIRAATWAQLRSTQTGHRLLYLNTHLDHISEAARLEGSRLIVQRLGDLSEGLPAIVTGDFNARAWLPGEKRESDVHRVYTQAGFRDAYLEAGHTEEGDTNTFHGFQGAGFDAEQLRIDWILMRGGLQAASCQIVRDAQPPLYPSDHYPVLAELALG